MKKILIIHTNLELGGAESSLLGLLQVIDYKNYSVDLLLHEKKGDLLTLIPNQVNVLSENYHLSRLSTPIKNVLLEKKDLLITIARLFGKLKGRNYLDKTYNTKLYCYKYAMPFLPIISGEYDMAISFIDPHFVLNKVNAKVKLGWLHTDFSRITANPKLDFEMWNCCDYIVNISDNCEKNFLIAHPEFTDKSIIIENILSESFVIVRSQEFSVEEEMSDDSIKLLSIGRFTTAKNFDNVPFICKKIIEKGLNVKWYLIGYGGGEQLIKNKISEAGVQDNVIILGKKENPYPYIKACDLYVQPSRFEGKCVAVREAQMLCKSVVITNYATSASQLKDGIDGIIVPMDNDACAEGIANVLNNPELMKKLSENCSKRDYSNSQEVEKLYKLIEE